MAKIVLATFGSLGDMHPKIALALELKARGHQATIAAMEFYRPKIDPLGLGFATLAPHLDPDNRELARELMDTRKGPETIIRGIIMPSLRQMYEDLTAAVSDADLLVTGEIVYAVKSVVEKTGIKWVSTSLQPGTFFSSYDPFIPPMAPWLENLRFLGPVFFRNFFALMRWTARDWYTPYKEFRRSLGLDEDHDPIFDGKYSPLLHLALFSRALAEPQPDWPPNTVQPGFCFYDEHEGSTDLPAELERFLSNGEPPIVFTLGSAAVMDPRDFFEEGAKAAKLIGRRAILLYGFFEEPEFERDGSVVGFPYAPYSKIFPRAACVVHQGGVGTTGQVLRAGVPHLIMPYSHDQPDNAARCRRLGVAEIISRDNFRSNRAASAINQILSTPSYSERARQISDIVRSERGTAAACDEIEKVLI
jgi:rhamnosyltransferase subunit B